MYLQGDRATGYGPVLLNTLFGGKSSNKLLQSIAPPLPLWEREGMEVEENTDNNKKPKLQSE